MGSSGSGNFTDYSNNKPQGKKNNGGSSGKDQCGTAFTTSLDEVARSEYFIAREEVPPLRTEVSVRVRDGRIAVIAGNEQIGYLPTEYNYILMCFADGYSYSGAVTVSANRPVPAIRVAIAPAS